MKLSPKQKIFCEKYILNGYNAYQAYLDAGYKSSKVSTARKSASKLLQKPEVVMYINHLENERIGDFTVTKDDILKELAKMAFGNIGHLIDISHDGRIKLRTDLTPEQKKLALASISSVGSSYSDGEKGMSKSFTIQNKDKLKALELNC
jgi:hypothetical protein